MQQYTILCYHSEKVVRAWTREEDDATRARLAVIQQKLAEQGKFGPVARLLPTASAFATELGRANPGGSYEIRPLCVFFPGTPQSKSSSG
jgi:hypothetical protein